jgi:hypothetical protein
MFCLKSATVPDLIHDLLAFGSFSVWQSSGVMQLNSMISAVGFE